MSFSDSASTSNSIEMLFVGVAISALSARLPLSPSARTGVVNRIERSGLVNARLSMTPWKPPKPDSESQPAGSVCTSKSEQMVGVGESVSQNVPASTSFATLSAGASSVVRTS
ncbi:hypothetical protein D3C83_58020 [compost metagenome]